MNRIKRVLIVDDDPEAADTLGLFLEMSTRPVSTLATYAGPSAISLASEGYFDVVVLDLQVGGYDGLQIAQEIRLRCANRCPKLIAFSTSPEKIAAGRKGLLFEHVFEKPVGTERLLDVIHAR